MVSYTFEQIMIINNKKKAFSIKILMSLFNLISLGVLVYLFYFNPLNDYLHGVLFLCFALAILTILTLKEYNYIIFDINGNKIILRHSSLGFSKRKSSIEIPKKSFHKYEIKKEFGLKTIIILFQKTPKGIAKYPAVSLSSLKKEDIKKIKIRLNSLK